MSFFPKSRGRVRRQASDWVARLAGGATEEEHIAFRRWRDSDPRHAEAYDRIAVIWNQAGRLSHSPATANRQADARSERPRAFGLAMAASLAAAVLVSVVLFGSHLLPGSASQQRPMLFAAAVGEIKKVGLPDGSRLTLDSGSRVEAVFTKAQRRLTLIEGRARFQVAHEARPFLVRAGSSEVVATGTLFDVSVIGGHTAVVLLQGSVEVRIVGARPARGSKVDRLTAGQKLILADSAPAERRQATRGDTNWPARMLEFDDTPLEEAAALANRYSKMQLKLGDGRVRGLRVSGAFRAGDVAGFARSLAAAFDLRIITRTDGTLLLVDANPVDRAPAK